MRISDWSSDVCSSDLPALLQGVQIAMLRPRAMLDLLVADAPNRGKLGLPRQFPKARGEPRGVDLVEPRHMRVHPCLADNGQIGRAKCRQEGVRRCRTRLAPSY